MTRRYSGARAVYMGAAISFCIAPVERSTAQTFEDLQRLSLEDLANVNVTSVTKTPESLSDAPASIYVIRHDEIVRSGALSIPEILRLAPNLQVQEVSANRYIITARGLSGNLAAQNFTNKLLVLIDGRSVYTPLFSGVYWDLQDVVPEDIDRIEVISGPGATLWGANAVNGVINIITRSSSETQGGLVDLRGGNFANSLTFRHGGAIRDGLTYRFYLRDYFSEDTKTADGANAHDHWSKPQGGFRVDWNASAADTLTFQGDGYKGSDARPGTVPENIDGANLVARWTHTWDSGASLQIQTFYDHFGRGDRAGGGNFWQDTFDVDVQHSFTLFDGNLLTWGGGYRSVNYQINGTQSLLFSPSGRTLTLGNVFIQDSISITPDVKAIAGIKFEADPYLSLSALPSIRLSWNVTSGAMVWGAVSRAIRSPTPFDVDVIEKAGPIVALTGNADFKPETLTAYEVGTRIQATPQLSFSLSGFYNVYDQLRSIELTPPGTMPFTWGNLLEGHTYGVEVWATYQLRPWWRLSGSLTELAESFHFAPGSTGLIGVAQLGDDPEHRASLRSSMDLGSDISFDADLRYVSSLPNPHVPAYVELNANIGWQVSSQVRFLLSGFNLLHVHHAEWPSSQASVIPRSVVAGLQWRF